VIDGLEHGRWALGDKNAPLPRRRGRLGGRRPTAARHGPSPVAPARLSRPAPRHDSLMRPFIPSAPRPIVQSAEAGVHPARAATRAALHPRDALVRSLSELILRNEVIGAPQTSLNTPIGSTRRFAVVRIPLAERKTISHELDGSVNDIVLAAARAVCGACFWSEGRSPLSEPARDGPDERAKGIRASGPCKPISSLFVKLPVSEPVAHARHGRSSPRRSGWSPRALRREPSRCSIWPRRRRH
jgi:hypothetical protein